MLRQIGPYEILRQLGAGGMGTVYLALDPNGRTVAVKVIHPHLATDETGLRRLAREGSAIRRIRSAYVAEFLDIDLLGSPPYIVTRYVQGHSLQQIINGSGPLPEQAVYGVAIGLASALDSVHAAGVVHRDLTPRNILIEEGAPIVIDFGISHEFDVTRMTQSFIGTPGFVAPEVIRGDRPEPAADVFSWAVTVVYAATGRNCFHAGTLLATLHHTMHEEPEISGLPPELAPMVRGALRKDPAERPTIQSLITGISALSLGVQLPSGALRGNSLDARLSDLWIAAGEARVRGDLRRADEFYEEAWQIAVRSGDLSSQMFASYQLGVTAEERGDHARAEQHYSRARSQAALKGAPNIEVLTLRGLERLARWRRDEPAARMYADLSHQVLEEKQDL